MLHSVVPLEEPSTGFRHHVVRLVEILRRQAVVVHMQILIAVCQMGEVSVVHHIQSHFWQCRQWARKN